MAQIGTPLDLTAYMGKARNRIHRIGIELEGAWPLNFSHKNHIVHDGSVVISLPVPHKVGELPSPPLEMTKNAEEGPLYWKDWLNKFYPNVVNDTCGMHVHINTITALSYARLMRPEFPATVVAYMKVWAEEEKLPPTHPIWGRLKGENKYCQHLFYGEEQAKPTTKEFHHNAAGHRYTVINYCWGRYKTFECRLLPMMETSTQAIRAIEQLARITNAFLLATAKKTKMSCSITVVGQSDTIQQTRRVSL